MGLEKPVIIGGSSGSGVITGTFVGDFKTSVAIDAAKGKSNIMFCIVGNGTVSGGLRSGVLNTENNSAIYYNSSTSNCHEKDILSFADGVLSNSKYQFMNSTYAFVAW